MAKENHEETKKAQCPGKRYDGSPCGRYLDDEVYCIFHSEHVERKKDKFNKAFDEEFKRQKREDKVYDFSGFVFPDSIKFSNTKFEKNTYFTDAKFLGEKTAFRGATFTSDCTDFADARFSGKSTFFGGATFSGEITSFSHNTFSGNYTEFMGATFSGEITSFTNATFSGELIDFEGAIFSGELIDFQGAIFSAEQSVFTRTIFSGKKIEMFNSYFNNIYDLFESLGYKIRRLRRKYNIKDFRFSLGPESANRYPLINRKTKDAWYLADFKRQHRVIYFFWWVFSDCGRVLWRWALTSLIIAIIFGGIYADYPCPSWLKWINCGQWLEKINPVMVIDQSNIHPENQDNISPRTKTWFTPYYFSIVTFTTLGFGDITPDNKAGEIWLAFEVIIGYLMLGGLISIFAVKLARRS